jgi:hypothetical protein
VRLYKKARELLRNSLAGPERLYNYHTLLIFLPSVNKMRFASFVIISLVTSAVHAIPVPLNNGSVATLEVRAGEYGNRLIKSDYLILKIFSALSEVRYR